MDFYPHNLQLYVCPMEILQDKGDDGYVSCGNKKREPRKAMAFYSQKSLGCGGVPPKKPGKEIKERNVEDSETAGFLEISSVYKNVSWRE